MLSTKTGMGIELDNEGENKATRNGSYNTRNNPNASLNCYDEKKVGKWGFVRL